MRIFSGIKVAALKFIAMVAIPAAYLLIKGFVDSVFPSSAREVYENL
jgi:hypothetical protein